MPCTCTHKQAVQKKRVYLSPLVGIIVILLSWQIVNELHKINYNKNNIHQTKSASVITDSTDNYVNILRPKNSPETCSA